MSVAIGTYVEIGTDYYFQNFHHGTTRGFNGFAYSFAGFGLHGYDC